MMDEHQWLANNSSRTRSPDADQEYFIDKMRMLKMRLRKYEEENRVLYQCLAEQKCDVRGALRDKCFVINRLQFEMSELKKHILVLLGVLADGESHPVDQYGSQRINSTNGHSTGSEFQQLHQQNPNRNQLPFNSPNSPFSTASSASAIPSEHDKTLWMLRNKSLEENFKKELRKVKELERQIEQLRESLQEAGRDREDLLEKNSFIEEENNIQREQIGLLEDTVKDLEEVAQRTNVELEEAETQTEISGEKIAELMNENVEEILCLVSKMTELQRRNEELEQKYAESRVALVVLQADFHERGKLMSELENELNGLKLRDRSTTLESERRRRSRRTSDEGAAMSMSMVLNPNCASVFLSPNSSSRSSSSNSSGFDDDEEEEGENGEALIEEEARKTEVRKFIRNLQNRRRTLHDTYRCSM